MDLTKLRIVLRTAYLFFILKNGSTAPSGRGEKRMRVADLQYANGRSAICEWFIHLSHCFFVFLRMWFLCGNPYGSCLMPMRANKKTPASLVWAREAGVFICSVSRQ